MKRKRKEYNDRVAFLQSGRIEDRVMRVCEEKCNSRSVSSKESEIDSASNGEETDDMPALTDSDMSDIGEPEKK